MFQYRWSTPVHWRHDGIDEIVVLGGDFKPNQRLMAYNLSDGAERWWVGGLPPSGKYADIGDGLLFLAAPDIILETAAERKDPDRAAQSMRRTRLESWLSVRAPRVKSARRISFGQREGVCQVFPHPCTTTEDSAVSTTAVSFSVESRGPASCCTPLGWEPRATTTPHQWLPTRRSTLHPKRAWWSCWMPVKSSVYWLRTSLTAPFWPPRHWSTATFT